MSPRASRPSIVFLNRFYWPDLAATAQLLTDLANTFAAAGWDVTVVTSRTSYVDGRSEIPAREEHLGVRIVRVGGPQLGRHNLARRTLDYLGYAVGAAVRLLRMPAPDIIVAMTDPPMLVAIPAVIGRMRGAKVVNWVQDLFPQIAAQLDVLSARSVSYRLIARLARWSLRRCDLVIALGPRMADAVVLAGARRERTTFIHNWVDVAAIQPVPGRSVAFRNQHGFTDEFLVMYSGNAGRAHEFETVLQAAEHLRDVPDVIFLFIGGGAQTGWLKEQSVARGLANVRFLDYVSRDQLVHSLGAADVSLVTERQAVAGSLVASKSYGILASGRPLIFVGPEEGDVAVLVRQASCGYVVRPGDSRDLEARLRGLHADREIGRRLGDAGRRAAERFFDRAFATQRWLELMERLAASDQVIARGTLDTPLEPSL